MMRTKLAAIALLSVPAVSASPAAAVTNFITNFDTVTFANGSHIVTSIEGWTGGTNGIEVQTGGVFGAPKSGANLVELDTTANSSMFRTVDAGIYTLTYRYSARPGAALATNGIGLYIGNTLLKTVASSGLVGNTPKTNTSWLTFTTTFTAQQASTLTFAALGASDGKGGYLDNIQLVGTALPVPEPGEWAMMLAGLGVVGFVASRRRSR